MKALRLFAAIAIAATLITGCGKDEPNSGKDSGETVIPTFKFDVSTADVSKDGGSVTISFIASDNWTASADDNWMKISSMSGSGSTSKQSITVTVDKNPSKKRVGHVNFLMGSLSGIFTINQETAGVEILNISEFKDKPVSTTEWYRITAKVAAIADDDFGNLYITDDSGYLYVYGLTAAKASTNDQTFKTLGIQAGDEITIVTLRSQYNDIIEAGGNTPAYCEDHSKGTYNGTKASSTKAGWMELPATYDDDKKDVLMHNFHTTGLSGRSYTSYWDYENYVATWVAYPLTAGNRGSGSRTDAWSWDPLLGRDQQPNVSKRSFQPGNGGSYIRGHQLPSADRLNRKDNIETFFGANITPQNSSLNEGVWEDLEGMVRTWSTKCDTLYVVTGCDVAGSTLYCLDNDDKEITVPVGYFKAILRYSKTDGYLGLAAYFKNEDPSSGTTVRKSVMSIDDLEKKLGIDFFVNLDDVTEATVEAANPDEESWWWK